MDQIVCKFESKPGVLENFCGFGSGGVHLSIGPPCL